MDTDVLCALDKNPALKTLGGVAMPYDWIMEPEQDNLPATQNGRCENYSYSPDWVELDVDGEDGPANFTKDEEAIEAICKHSGRGRHQAKWREDSHE